MRPRWGKRAEQPKAARQKRLNQNSLDGRVDADPLARIIRRGRSTASPAASGGGTPGGLVLPAHPAHPLRCPARRPHGPEQDPAVRLGFHRLPRSTPPTQHLPRRRRKASLQRRPSPRRPRSQSQVPCKERWMRYSSAYKDVWPQAWPMPTPSAATLNDSLRMHVLAWFSVSRRRYACSTLSELKTRRKISMMC